MILANHRSALTAVTGGDAAKSRCTWISCPTGRVDPEVIVPPYLCALFGRKFVMIKSEHRR